jgi:eukaryotic-like serine/threonine-protein kinase
MLQVLANNALAAPDVTPLPPPLQPIVARLLALRPEDRYIDAQAVIHELVNAMDLPGVEESTLVRESFLQASTFVGRDAEFDTLKIALHSTLKETGSLWLVGGESGVGKSRLLEELRAYALVKGALVLRGQAVAEGGLPFQLWRDVVRRLALNTSLDDLQAGVLKALVPDIDTLLERDIPPVPELSGPEGQQRLVLTVVELFKQQTQPILLLLEDLHWADESLVPLKQMLTITDQLPMLMVVATYRNDEKPDLPFTTVHFLERIDFASKYAVNQAHM